MKTIILRILRRKKMSKAGFNRLDNRLKLNYKDQVYPPVFNGEVNTELIESEVELARWLFTKFGEGYYVLMSWKTNPKGKGKGRKCLTKALAKVNVYSVEGNKLFDYDFEETRGISRYTSFWQGEY